MSTEPDPTETDQLADQLIFDVFEKSCPSRPALEHITGRWGTLVILGLRAGPTRFNELRRRVEGVSEKMLSQNLHALERDGFVARTVHSTIPPRVEYSLTALGKTTTDMLADIVHHLEANMPTILAAQERYDADEER
jgi:DNA-binding HxlR family transcriptional regulator